MAVQQDRTLALRCSYFVSSKRTTLHALESDARTPLADFFSILLMQFALPI